jgi:hypothetical protein
MAEPAFREQRRRVFLPQALGGDEYLRVTWHEDDRVVVFSHWEGERCVAATPVRVAETGDLATLLVEALAKTASQQPALRLATAEPTRWERLVAALRRARTSS